MADEILPEPKTPLPKRRTETEMSQREFKDLYAEVVSLRQDLNKALTYINSQES